MFPTKRTINARLEALEEETTNENPRLEVLPEVMRYNTEPRLTADLMFRGFVVEREPQTDGPGRSMVRLQTTPSMRDVTHAVLWHTEGPTAPKDEIRIAWDDDRREAVLEAADSDVVSETPTLPSDPVVVADGDGWEAVVTADRVVENMILRQAEAETFDYEILGPVPPWIDGTDEYDLVEVDAEPVPYADRRPT